MIGPFMTEAQRDSTNLDEGARLEIREELEGPQHFLSDALVHRGDMLEVLLDDGTWLAGRYDWNGDPVKAPWLLIALGNASERGWLSLPPRAVLRWAEPGEA